ncbi:hypothetical protein HDV02_004664 [Globomyces sp. JEL0801]|nr:hypothetical protein HDV02_004664 [Globomyces sp. JEL0801]
MDIPAVRKRSSSVDYLTTSPITPIPNNPFLDATLDDLLNLNQNHYHSSLPHTESMSDVDDTLTDVSENVAPSNDYRQTRLKFAIGFCFALFVLQLVGGYISGSLALMADAFHMLSDVLGYAISLMAIRFAVKERSSTYNYGYKRLEVLGALASITLVWILTIGLVMEAIERLQNPEPINGRTMLYMAISGVVFNAILIFVFGHEEDHHEKETKADIENSKHSIPMKDMRGNSTEDDEISLISQDSPKNESKTELAQHTKNDINIRAAMLHAIGDLLCSMGVLTSALIICYFPKMQWVDPLCTFIFAIVAIFTTLSVLKDIGLVLMQGNPGNIDQSQVKGQLLQIQGVSRVIDVKLWALTMESMVATIELECHSHLQVKDTAIIVKRAKKICSEFGIYDTSVQII